MKTNYRRGSALALVLIASIFLIILTAGAYRYFQTNVGSQIWSRERIQAKLSAEAGLNLATHMLVAGASLPTETDPQDFLGTELSPMNLPGNMGSVSVSVDPNNFNPELIMANAFLLRCVAYVSGSTIESYGMETIVMPENLARFAVFMDNPSTSGYYEDGYRFDGPFYANGPVWIQSESFDHVDDVFFYSFELTSGFYVYGPSKVPETTPAVGKLQMRPYNRLILGAPYFDLDVDPIPFGASDLNWQGVRDAALADGLYLTTTQVPSGSRLALKGDTLFVRTDTLPAVATTYYLGDLVNPVVWVQNGPLDYFYLRGDQNLGLDMALTIGTIGSFYMSGPLSYANEDPQDPENENILGLMTVQGHLRVADDPLVNDSLWGSEHFHIRTDTSFTYYGVLVALEGMLDAEEPKMPEGVNEFRIVGGYMIQEEGFSSYGLPKPSGFNMAVYFDPRLLYMHPPFFPTTANWNTTLWGELPDLTAADVANGPHPPY